LLLGISLTSFWAAPLTGLTRTFIWFVIQFSRFPVACRRLTQSTTSQRCCQLLFWFISITQIPVLWRVSVFYLFSSKNARDFRPHFNKYFISCVMVFFPIQAIVFFRFYCYNIKHRNWHDKFMTQIYGKLSI